MATRYCKCGHPESNHHHETCNGELRSEYPKLVLCGCKQFEPKPEKANQANTGQLAEELRKRADDTRKRAKPGEDASQAAARIVREATKD